MRLFLLLLLVAVVGEYTPVSDGAPSDENLAATYSTNKVVGEVLPQGADRPFQRLVDTVTGAGLFTTNSDPSVVGVDPLTGEDAPVGTDVGFGAAVRRYVQTGVLNGDFALGPPDPDAPISDDNPLPYWTWVPPGDGLTVATWGVTTASGPAISFDVASTASDAAYLEQLVPVPKSTGQQYRVLLSMYNASSPDDDLNLWRQFLKSDLSTIGSELSFNNTSQEGKVDAGLVPSTASYIRLRIGIEPGLLFKPATIRVSEVRAAFLPAEATVGLKSNTANVGAITTSQTQVVGITIPANSLTVGSVYEFDAWGNVTSSAANVVTLRLRIGTTSLTGNIIDNVAPTATTTASNNSVHITGTVTVRSVGASGTIIGGIQFIGQDTQPFTVRLRASQATGTVAVDTTVANILELTAVTGAGTTSVTFQQATIRCVMAS